VQTGKMFKCIHAVQHATYCCNSCEASARPNSSVKVTWGYEYALKGLRDELNTRNLAKDWGRCRRRVESSKLRLKTLSMLLMSHIVSNNF